MRHFRERVVDPLTEVGYCGLNVQLTSFASRRQPACTVCPSVLQEYVAKPSRTGNRGVLCGETNHNFHSLLVFCETGWSSASAKTTCIFKTYKESLAAIKTSSKSVTFLIAATETGVIVGLKGGHYGGDVVADVCFFKHRWLRRNFACKELCSMTIVTSRSSQQRADEKTMTFRPD